MKKILLSLIIITFFSCTKETKVVEIGKTVPNYTFNEVLNIDQKSFSLKNQHKPIIIEFWATWCSPCIPAMKKLESLQEKYKNEIEIITVSTDSKKNLKRYIENTKTSLRIAFDTTHLKPFKYKYIPHIILVNKEGIVQVITTPEKVTDQIVADLIAGKNIQINEIEKNIIETNFKLDKQFKNNEFQYKLTSENKKVTFKNEIKRNDDNEPIYLDFNNVSIYRLLKDIYELSSAARIYSENDISSKNKYCFNLEQSSTYDKKLLQHAKEILNTNLDVKVELIEKEMDSIYILEIIDKAKLPIKSTEQKKYFTYRGPYYLGKKITSYNLIEYLENEVFQPVKDKVQLDYTFDIELNWSYEDTKSLNRELKKYGLRISKSEKPEKIQLLQLTKKKVANTLKKNCYF